MNECSSGKKTIKTPVIGNPMPESGIHSQAVSDYAMIWITCILVCTKQ